MKVETYDFIYIDRPEAVQIAKEYGCDESWTDEQIRMSLTKRFGVNPDNVRPETVLKIANRVVEWCIEFANRRVKETKLEDYRNAPD